MNFILNLNTQLCNPFTDSPITNAVSILSRDMHKALSAIDGIHNSITLVADECFEAEAYLITVTDENQMSISASDSLGFVYGLLAISRQFLQIKPFWFWMDQDIQKLDSVEIPIGTYTSVSPAVRYRGWFLNDEVLLMHWNNGMDSHFPWRMAFEALLRCGGNMVIPGTDKSGRLNIDLAFEYGLWLTHHHAEPLGAELFARTYPDFVPSYSKYPEHFQKLWEDAVVKYKDQKVIWTLGFRGQGDCPFWESQGEETYDTPEKRGKLISDIIELQRQIVCKYVEHPVCCTNLYGEVMELYNAGFIHFHPDIIKIWADNGFGKMCTRRQGNHDARVPSLPDKEDRGMHGVYYHVSFHDLQAAGHITTLANPVDFVNRELKNAYALGVDDYWMINSSNIRPHVYYLDAIRKLWYGKTVSDASHSVEFASDYYGGHIAVASCLENYARSLLSYGTHEDQHAGEEFYNYCVRLLARQFIIDRTQNVNDLYWLTGDCSLWDQAERVLHINKQGEAKITGYYKQCSETSARLCGDEKILFDATILLQATIHHKCNQGSILFCEGFLLFDKGNYQESFYCLGQAAQLFEEANQSMREAEYGIWKGFYENDCLVDMKFTAYVIRSMMRVIRVIGDDSRFADWQEEFVCSKADRNVRLLSTTENHMTDDALFDAMKCLPSMKND